MAETRRVIVTGNNTAGKSIVIEDVHVGMSGPGNFDFWQTEAETSPLDGAIGRAAMKFFPAGGGTMFRLFTIPPADPNMTQAEMAATARRLFPRRRQPHRSRSTPHATP